jgi:glycosyltransferase involved in cell wall biosynthesis
MPRPRIAIDFTALDATSPVSGQYRYAVSLVRGLARLRPDVSFLLLGSKSEPVPELGGVFQKYNDRWDYRSVPRRQFRGAAYLDHARYGWVLLRERVSLLHSLHTFIPLCSPCPVVITVYDLMYELFDDYEEGRRSRPYRIHRWAVGHRARRVVCISETTAADLRNLWGVGEHMLDVIPLGSPFASTGEAAPDVRPETDHTPDASPVLVSPYNLEPRKNLGALLEAVALLRSRGEAVKLILFGRAAVTPEREERFEREVRELGLGDYVVRTGILGDAGLAALYRRATLFVFPSLYEGFGLPVLEAMAAGACVVARDASAMSEVLRDTGALVETGDPRALASVMATLLDDASLRDALGRRARARAALFSIERMALLTYRSYLTALDRTAHPSPVQNRASR